MNRPYLVNFSAIASDSRISIKAHVTDSITAILAKRGKNPNSSPIQSIKLFAKKSFRIKVQGLSEENVVIFDREYDTDDYGIFELAISQSINSQNIKNLRLFEVRSFEGVFIHLGSLIPMEIKSPKKIVISDFDKTLVETKYSSLKEVYYSLNRPLSYFPTIEPSIEILRNYINNDFQPFILSASPHFYENAIRDWLYQNKIFAGSIFLKDYRDFISIFNGDLSRKDLKRHGYYKLNQLVEILLMTGLPDELVLIGDGFESDTFIYLTLRSLIIDRTDPWKLWKSIKNNSIFSLNNKQDSHFLTKFYRLSELSRLKRDTRIEIFIRTNPENDLEIKDRVFDNPYVQAGRSYINYYTG